MAVFVKGNYCWQLSSTEFNIGGNVDKFINMFLLQTSTSNSTGNSYVHQPGRLKAVNVHVAANSLSIDCVIRFTRRKWNAGNNNWDNQPDVLLITIPAGATGYFCSALSEGNTTTSWTSKDVVGISFNTAAGSGTITGITVGICLEITEEVRVDTGGLPNRPPT